jgi:hypothetical protein
MAISGNAASGLWAVGSGTNGETNGDGPSFPIALHLVNGSWENTPCPAPTPASQLTSVSALSSSDVWTVGTQGTGESLVENWNGSSWNVVSSANGGNLAGIAVTTNGTPWAVGWSISDPPQAAYSFVETGSTSGLSLENSASVPGAQYTWLYSITAVPGGGMWAVGNTQTGSGDSITLIELLATD